MHLSGRLNDGQGLLAEDESSSRQNSFTRTLSNISTTVMNWLPDRLESAVLFRNFGFFVLLFCIVHATADTVLVFTTAELGMDLGSKGSFLLNLFYTLSSFFIAKPFLVRYGSKNAVTFGLLGLIMYVFSFFIAVGATSTSPQGAVIFQLGATLGGIGAGLLWTGQGSYFSSNAILYAQNLAKEQKLAAPAPAPAAGAGDGAGALASTSASATASAAARGKSVSDDKARDAALAKFAALFAVGYLILETIFKTAATGVYLAKNGKDAGADSNGNKGWKKFVFGLYAVIAVGAWVAFQIVVQNLDKKRQDKLRSMRQATSALDDDYSSMDDNNGSRSNRSDGSDIQLTDVREAAILGLDPVTGEPPMAPIAPDDGGELWPTIRKQSGAVLRALLTNRKLQLLLPYQVMFGFSAGFLNAYVNAKFVAKYLGDGYIGVLSAVVTITAAIASYPYSELSIRYKHGSYYVMIFGGLSFMYAGVSIWATPDDKVGTWSFLGVMFWMFGFGRGAWESTNKATVAAFFKDDPSLKDAAFAAVYFSSGIAMSISFATFQYLSKFHLVCLQTFVPLIAILCFHLSYDLHTYDALRKHMKKEELAYAETGEMAGLAPLATP